MRALARAGLEPAGPLGVGTTGPRLAARDADGRGWAVTVVGPGEMARSALRSRIAALAALTHPHVAAVAPLLELRDGSAVALQAEVVGPDLATVARARGPWRPGEVVTLVVPLAQALAALHEAGVAHGDVSPGNVVLERDGRPVLVDLVCGARTAELGTPGLAAPERRLGAEPAGDVHALGRLGLALLEGAGAAAPVVGGVERARPDSGAAALRRVLDAAADPDPARRPDAAELATRAYAACAPEPVTLPDAAVLARLTLRRLAAPPEDATVVGDLPAAVRRGRHRRRSPWRAPALVAAVGLAFAGGLTAIGAYAGGRPADGPGAVRGGAADAVGEGPASMPGGAAGALTGDPVTAAVRLTVRRAEALATRDAPALASVTVPGSTAADADRWLAASLWPLTPSGGGAVVEEAHLVSRGTSRPGGRPQAEVLVRARAVVTTQPAPAGATLAAEGEGASAVVLVLEAGRTGWRVSAVQPAPAA